MASRLQFVLKGFSFIGRSVAPRFATLSATPFADAKRAMATASRKVMAPMNEMTRTIAGADQREANSTGSTDQR